jgi:hypothetical protein
MGDTAAIMTLAGAATSATTQFNQAGAVVSQAGFDQKMAAINATDAINRGNAAAARVRAQTAEAVGAQRAAGGASGVDVGSGSAADVQSQERKFSALDLVTIGNNAAREAWGYTANSELGMLAAKQTAAADRAGAFETLATGAAKAYGIFKNADYNKPTPKPTAVRGQAR